MEAFLRIEGIDGECRDERHPNEIELISYDFGAEQQGGKPSLSSMSVVKRVDKSSPKLLAACCTGQFIESAVIAVRRGGSAEDQIGVKLSTVLVASYRQSGECGAEGGSPTERVTFDFGKIEFEYKEQQADGTVARAITAGFDLVANQAI